MFARGISFTPWTKVAISPAARQRTNFLRWAWIHCQARSFELRWSPVATPMWNAGLFTNLVVDGLYLFVGEALASYVDDQTPPVGRLAGKTFRLDGPI